MDANFSALAARIGSDVEGSRGCIIVSKDGLVLGSFPQDSESFMRPAWLRFGTLGEVRRGFLELPGELWAFVQRDSYAAFVIASSPQRPGLLLDALEQALLEHEEAQTRSMPVPMPTGGGEAPRSKPRSSLHRSQSDLTESVAASAEVPPTAAAPPSPPVQSIGSEHLPVQSVSFPPVPAASPSPDEQDADVDRVMLAQEFAQLLGESADDDDAE